MNDREFAVTFVLGAIAGGALVLQMVRDRPIHIIDQDGISVDREDVR